MAKPSRSGLRPERSDLCAPECREHVSRTLVAAIGVLLEAAVNDGALCSRHAHAQLWDGLLAHDRRHELESLELPERLTPGCHLIEEHAEGPHVAAGIRRPVLKTSGAM